MNIALDFPMDYILEVDLEYPKHLHDAHIDLLFSQSPWLRNYIKLNTNFRTLATISRKISTN